jgi:hypothetical protein
MLFEEKKLQLNSASRLLQCPINSIEPFALMISPVYVLMEKNKKFVSIKAPLDFFTAEELEKFKNYKAFYFPEFVNSSIKFQTAAIICRNLLTLSRDEFPMASYEISRENFSVLSPLWGMKAKVEPFFACVFANELCHPLNSKKMLHAREKAVIRHDQGLLLSGLVVFVMIHLGWSDFNFVNDVRQKVYLRTVDGEEWHKSRSELELMISDLYQMILKGECLSVDFLIQLGSDWSQKLLARILQKDAIEKMMQFESATIFGDQGFAA